MATDVSTPGTPAGGVARGKSLPLPGKNTCARCGYALEALPTPLCPECGLETQPAAPSLTERTATGFAFMAAQMVITRVLGIVGNLILAWLLLPADFGLITMAMGIVAFAQVVQTIGVREVLIRRQSSYRHLANAGFWISVSSGMMSAVAVAAAAPLAARFFGEPKIVGLLLVLAAAMPIANASIVPEARLQIDLRFRWVAMLNMISAGGTVVLMVAFAALGFGAYSFVLPRLILAIVRTALAWRIAGFAPRFDPQTRRWRFIIGASLWVLLANLCITVQMQADAIMLGRALDSDNVGLYGFATSVSMQAVVLLAFSLGQILLPALSKLQEDAGRQADALVRAMRVLAMLIVPTCVLQAAVADPIVRLIFPDKWVGAIGVLQVLSLGMSLRFFGISSNALFQAQGRFRMYFLMTFGAACFYLAVVAPVVFLTHNIVFTAVAVSVCLGISEPLGLYLALKPTGRGMREVLSTFIAPLLISLIACAAGWWCASLLPVHAGRIDHLWRVLVTCAVAGPLMLIGMRTFMRPSWDEALLRIAPMLSRILGRSRLASA